MMTTKTKWDHNNWHDSIEPIGYVMVSVLVSSVVDRGVQALSSSNQRLQNWYLLLLC